MASLFSWLLKMRDEKYRITAPTVVLIAKDGRHVAHTVPRGAVVTVDDKTGPGGKFLTIMWGGIEAMIFAPDLQSHGERIIG